MRAEERPGISAVSRIEEDGRPGSARAIRFAQVHRALGRLGEAPIPRRCIVPVEGSAPRGKLRFDESLDRALAARIPQPRRRHEAPSLDEETGKAGRRHRRGRGDRVRKRQKVGLQRVVDPPQAPLSRLRMARDPAAQEQIAGPALAAARAAVHFRLVARARIERL